MTNFSLIFAGVLAFNIVVTLRSSDLYKKWRNRSDGLADSVRSLNSQTSFEDDREKREWRSLLRRYLLVYLLATLSDWLQGPYVYALYADYGFSQHRIAVLFVAGFGSSMVFGSFVGGMADWGGRRNFVVLFAFFYAASCINFKDFRVLLLGRMLGGVSTSLLFSVFEAWLIRAHADAKLSKAWLPKSFAWAAYSNSVIAIVAGLLANRAASAVAMKPFENGGDIGGNMYYGGYLGPFDIALGALLLCGFFARFTWEENYGEGDSSSNNTNSNTSPATPTSSKSKSPISRSNSSSVSKTSASAAAAGGTAGDDVESSGTATSADHTDDANKTGAPTWYGGLRSAFTTTIRNPDILLCGAVSALFEGSMYVFVFMWTPSLAEGYKGGGELPFGLIFSTFMVCCMAGSSLFTILLDRYSGEQMAVGVFVVAAASMALVAYSGDHNTIRFLGMNLFEVTVGMYFPIMGTQKGNIVPESKRAAIYNLYRIPLNFIVLFSLLTDLTPKRSFVLNALMLSGAAVLQWILMNKRRELVSAMDYAGSASAASASAASATEVVKLLQVKDSDA